MNRYLFGLTHPRQLWLYWQHQRILRQIRQQAQFGHQPPLRQGRIRPVLPPAGWLPTESAVLAADRIIAGDIRLYGHQVIKLKQPIDWQRDYLSKFVWPAKQFYADFHYDYPAGADVKTPWEISRSHQLVTVALAYHQTKEEKYAQYVVAVITDWIKSNPVYYGVNWLVAMEVAIRACNWLVAYQLIAPSAAAQTDQFSHQFLGSLEEHGQFIWQNLEQFGAKSNHYFSDLVGLVWLGLSCPELPDAHRWITDGFAEFERAVSQQFYPDGVNFEASTSYHRLVAEMAGWTVYACQYHHLQLQQHTWQRLERALQVSQLLTKPNGQLVQFGDNDSGRFLILERYFDWQPLDSQPLIQLARLLFPKRQLEVPKLPFCQVLPDGQLFVWRQTAWYLAVTAARLGQAGNGGHNHDDVGSFELSLGQENIIVDPGTGYYTSYPKIRQQFRHVLAHNAPVVAELAHQSPPGLFQANHYSRLANYRVHDQQLHLTIQAENYTVTRAITVNEQTVGIIDQVASPVSAQLQVRLTLPVGLKPQLLSNQSVKLTRSVQLVVESGQVKLQPQPYSPGYGQVVSSQAVIITGHHRLAFRFQRR